MQIKVQVNEGSDTGSDADDDDDTGNDKDASSAASKSDSEANLSSAEDGDANKKLQSAADRLCETQSSTGLTVTPIKIAKYATKRIRTMDRILHLKHSRRRGRPPLTQNVSLERCSLESLSRTPTPSVTSAVTNIRKMRGRPKGSKNKVKKWPWLGVKQSEKDKQKSFQLTADTLEVGNYALTEQPQTAVKDSCRGEYLDEAQSGKKSSKQTFWRPPTDADSRRVLDQISITDVTANALTVTVRESATQDGFFRS